jgi:hypothetical protein
VNYVILSARRYDFEDDKGKQVKGITLTYADPEEVAEDGRKGFTLLTINAPDEIWRQLRDEPALYRLDFRQRPGRGGKPVLQVVSCEYVQPFSLALQNAA